MSAIHSNSVLPQLSQGRRVGSSGRGADDRLERSFDPNPFSVRYVRPGAMPFFFEPRQMEAWQQTTPDQFDRFYFESLLSGEDGSTWIGASFLTEGFVGGGFRGQIVGPHGSGKSTLMEMLRKVLEFRGYSVFHWSLHDRQRLLPVDFWENLEAFLRDVLRAERFSPPESRSTTEEQPPTKDSKPFSSRLRDIPLTPYQKEPPLIFLDGFEQLSLVNRFLFRTFCRNHRLGFLLSTHSAAFGLPILTRTLPSLEILLRVVDYLVDDADFSPTKSEIKELYLRNRGNFRSILFDLYDRFEESLL